MFVTNFCQIVLVLEDSQQPMIGLFQKTMFLSKIKDRDYNHIQDLCMEDKRLLIQDTITKMETKWKTLQLQQKPQQNPSTTPRQVNKTSTLTANQVVKLSINKQI